VAAIKLPTFRVHSMTFDPLAAVILIARTLRPGVPAFRHHSVLGNFLKSRDSLEEARVSREFPEKDDRPEHHESPDDDFSR